MVNNEFHIIGTAVSDYVNYGSGTFQVYKLKVEIEKFNSKGAKTFPLEVYVYGTNRAVDVRRNPMGKLVAINGYLDSIPTEKNGLIAKLVVQNIYFLSSSSKVVAVADTKPAEDKVVVDDFNDIDLPI